MTPALRPLLSVVIPVHNEAAHLRPTIDALVEAVERSSLDAELVIVDDGSTDGSADVARDAVGTRLPLRLVSQANAGRFAARRSGIGEARAEHVLLLDARVRIRPDALEFARARVEAGDVVWTGHVDVHSDGNLYGLFWQLLAELAWFDYFREPREMSFGADVFDRFPKGTTCFLAPRRLLVDATEAFESRYADLRHANDDTPLIRWIAERERIHISPRFACDYRPRTTLAAFARHSFHRGVVFVDGHGRPESRFFPAVVAFYPASLLLAVAAARRPVVAVGVSVAASATAAVLGLARKREPREVTALAALAPVYGLFHGAGMWRGLLMLSGRRGGRAGSPP
jgi:glycosyltransferase involved in cell wall biosynthesis